MKSEEIVQKVISLMSSIFEVRGFDTDLIECADLIDDMGMDSITFISLVVELEAEFEIMIPNDLLVLSNFNNANAIAKIVECELTAKT